MIVVEVYKLIDVTLQKWVMIIEPNILLYKHSVYATLLCVLDELVVVVEVDKSPLIRWCLCAVTLNASCPTM